MNHPRRVNVLVTKREGKPARYYLDGKRTTREAVDLVEIQAERGECVHSTTTRDGLRRSYSVAVLRA